MKNLRIILLILLPLWVINGFSQKISSVKSPHGKGLKIECSECHDPNGWALRKYSTFNHDKTHFPLRGQHKMVSCRSCHKSLIFSEAKPDCNACHSDVHQQTVGLDCARCHNTSSWIVTNIRQIHQQKGFALVGAHAAADCRRCHASASQLQFENMHTDCDACHHQDYESAIIANPGYTNKGTHRSFGFDTDCFRCHNMVGRSWAYNGKGFEHGFFPLKGGHANLSCNQCHWDGFNTKLDPECSGCHGTSTASQKVPAHNTEFKDHECSECHTYLSWNTVRFNNHKPWRSSGKHKNRGCLECHDNDREWEPDCRKCHNFDF